VSRIFEFGGHDFELAGEAALYWPAENTLLVSDMHLEKASAFARTGQMLPPYDSLSTLHDVAALVAQFRPQRIISLGDNFHDDAGEVRLPSDAADLLRQLVAQTDWVWITGNHDRNLEARWGGRSVDELVTAGVILRHEAMRGENEPEISGHFHPKYRQVLRGRMVSRRCFVKGPRKLIMPAFGAFTGGLDAQDVAITRACDLAESENAEALVPTHSGFARFRLNCERAFAK
jgi:DNA ligase-associated metallophosphoesterase